MSRSTYLVITALSLIAVGVHEGTAQEAAGARDLIKRFDTDGDRKLNGQELSRALVGDQPKDPAGDRPKDLDFVRVTRRSNGEPKSLETAVASFRSADGSKQIDLIGAIHVGDKSYYEELNRRFRDYDVVLYELIAPKGTRVPRGGKKSDHPVGRMQRAIKSMLDLSFQLDEIDYSPKHLVHADMSPQEFASSMKERGESFLQILFRMLGQSAAQSARSDAPSDRDLLMALFAPDRALRLKRILAGQFENLEGQMNFLEGPSGSTLISERNKRALQILQRQQDQGHKKIGIFYGAGHMIDMAERLQSEFGLQYVSSEWLKAWDMTGDSQ